MTVLVGLAVVLLAIRLSAAPRPWMVLLTGLLGALTYATVPVLQARGIGLSHRHAPQAPAVAAGLNIAGFNDGIALGSLLDGVSLDAMVRPAPLESVRLSWAWRLRGCCGRCAVPGC